MPAVVGNPADLLPVRVGAVGVAIALDMMLVYFVPYCLSAYVVATGGKRNRRR